MGVVSTAFHSTTISLTLQPTKPRGTYNVHASVYNFHVDALGTGSDVNKLPSGIWLTAPDWSVQNLCR